METWQGIKWKYPQWGINEWIGLESLLNSSQEFQMLVVSYPNELIIAECMRTTISVKYAESLHWYERSAIQRALFHEGLFSVFQKWIAVFNQKLKDWVWKYSPREGGKAVNAMDFDTLHKESEYLDYPYQPRVLKTSHGDLLRVGEDRVVFPEYSYRIDPLVNVQSKESIDGKIYGGVFILPPGYKAELRINKIQSLPKTG